MSEINPKRAQDIIDILSAMETSTIAIRTIEDIALQTGLPKGRVVAALDAINSIQWENPSTPELIGSCWTGNECYIWLWRHPVIAGNKGHV